MDINKSSEFCGTWTFCLELKVPDKHSLTDEIQRHVRVGLVQGVHHEHLQLVSGERLQVLDVELEHGIGGPLLLQRLGLQHPRVQAPELHSATGTPNL